jgi:hypothetical protein
MIVNGNSPSVQPPDLSAYHGLRELQRELGVGKIDALLALSANHDPFNAGTPGKVSAARWFAAIYRQFEFAAGYHLRRMHYRMIVSDPPPLRNSDMTEMRPGPKKAGRGEVYENTIEAWKELCEASAHARHLDLVAADAFEDHRNPDPLLFDAYGVEASEPTFLLNDVLPWELPSIGLKAASDLSLRLPQIETSGYEYSLRDQPYHLESWIEKTTMNDVLVPICQELGVDFIPGTGFQSISGAIKALQRLLRLPLDRPTRIFYISDFDPAGNVMPIAVARHLEFYRRKYAPLADIKLTPIVLTKAQVIKYRLPRVPIKESDLGRNRFEDAYGAGAVELDALEALHPGELAKIVRAAIKPYRDLDIEDALSDAADEAQEEAEQAWEDATQAQREALEEAQEKIAEIAERYRQEAEALDARLQAELDPLRPRLDELREEIQQAAADLEVALPERPVAERAEVDEEDWLFSSDRSYVEQLRHYQARKHGDNGRQRKGRKKTK